MRQSLSFALAHLRVVALAILVLYVGVQPAAAAQVSLRMQHAGLDAGPGQGYKAIRLLAPRTNSRIFFPQQPLLKWSSAGALQEADFYVVKLTYPNDQGSCQMATKDTSLAVPATLFRFSSFGGRFTWSVSVKREAGERTHCAFIGDTIGSPSSTWRFTWTPALAPKSAATVPPAASTSEIAPAPAPAPVAPNAPAPVEASAFPCSNTSLMKLSNLCIAQPYPVPAGTSAYAIWNITDFREGAFDRGDGRGFVGPISAQMRVELPDVTAGQVIRLRWTNQAGQEFTDAMRLSVGTPASLPVAPAPPNSGEAPEAIYQPTLIPLYPQTPFVIDQPTVEASPTAEETPTVVWPEEVTPEPTPAPPS